MAPPDPKGSKGKHLREESMEDFTPDWCQRLLSDPSYTQSSPFTRRLYGTVESPHNSLMAQTLFTDHTLRAIRYLYKSQEAIEEEDVQIPSDVKRSQLVDGFLALVSLGNGLCSHNGTLHGGITSVLVDEIGAALAYKELPDDKLLMTLNFNISLRNPVKLPGIVLGRAWIERAPEGRKVWLKVRLEQDGQTCVESETLYLKMNRSSNL